MYVNGLTLFRGGVMLWSVNSFISLSHVTATVFELYNSFISLFHVTATVFELYNVMSIDLERE